MAQPASTLSEIRARILIVDDHPHTGATLARILGGIQMPAEILTALNGQEALAMIGEGVDVLIVDFLMPDMTGLELIERVRALPIRQPARVILITAHHSPELIELSRRVKVDDYLIKPVYPKQIRGLVEDALQELYPASSSAPVRL
ncbi:MAG TPA: response regulator [Anaerolineae bacterium]|nr:response regulator [Anaerolineae bacterium]